MRYERKYRIENRNRYLLEQLLWLHPAGFSEAFPERQVNNIYWDTVNWDFANDNTSGISSRSKIRVRWYGATEGVIKNPVLEIKSRLNQQGDKVLIPLADCAWEDLHEMVSATLQKQFPDKAFQPVLVNSFRRFYYLSMDRRFRLTLDEAIQYGPWLPWHFTTPMEDRAVIAEMKYEAADDADAEEIARYLALRMVRHSKYMQGLALVHQTTVF